MKKNISEQQDLQRQELAKTLVWAYKILPVCYGIIIIIRSFTGGWATVYSMITATLIIPIAYVFVKKDKVETSLILLITSLIFTVTVAITFANGIHDIGLMAYPIILLLSSMMLRFWHQIITYVLVMIAIIWLAIGEKLGYYSSLPVETGTFSELVIILLIISASAIISYRIASNLKEALKSRDQNVKLTAKKINLLQDSLSQKIKVTNAIHRQVVDSLSIIRELISKQKNQPLKNLPNQLLTIELVHAELYWLELEKELDLENYLDQLFSSQVEGFKHLTKNRIADIMLNVDQAMSLGMFFTELAFANTLDGELNVLNDDNKIDIVITDLKTSLIMTPLADIMIRQLNAEVVNTPESFKMSFQQAQHSVK